MIELEIPGKKNVQSMHRRQIIYFLQQMHFRLAKDHTKKASSYYLLVYVSASLLCTSSVLQKLSLQLKISKHANTFKPARGQ